MKKKLYIFSMLLALACATFGCGKEEKKDVTEEVSVKEDVVEFINDELTPIEAYRNSAIAVYNSYFATEDVDLNLFITNMKDSAIPSMETYISNLTNVEVATTEVTTLKNLCLQSAQKQHDAMLKIVLAVEEQNPDYLTEAETLITEAEESMAQFESNLRTIATDNGITIEGSVSY